jgi:hypothetical protein
VEVIRGANKVVPPALVFILVFTLFIIFHKLPTTAHNRPFLFKKENPGEKKILGSRPTLFSAYASKSVDGKNSLRSKLKRRVSA